MTTYNLRTMKCMSTSSSCIPHAEEKENNTLLDPVKKNDFDKEFLCPFENKVLEYGIIKGNSTVCLLKAGLNGSMRGYQNKYFEIGKHLNEKYGYTVVCASNPETEKPSIFSDIKFIREHVNLVRHIYYMGHSDAAVQGAQYGYWFPFIERMLLINPPLMINFHKLKNGISQFQGERAVFIFGQKDPSFQYSELLDNLISDKIFCFSIPDADHHFTGKLKEFKELFEKYLLCG